VLTAWPLAPQPLAASSFQMRSLDEVRDADAERRRARSAERARRRSLQRTRSFSL